jgi:hypothetical protein
MERAVDEGQATSEDYTIFIASPPKDLGAGGKDAGDAAVKAYTDFFAAVHPMRPHPCTPWDPTCFEAVCKSGAHDALPPTPHSVPSAH